MKFNHILLLLIVLVHQIVFTVQTSVKNKSRMRMRSKLRSRAKARSTSRTHRRQSMMEYMNTFFSDKNEEDEEINSKKNKRKYRFREEDDDKKDKKSDQLQTSNKYKIHEKKDSPKPVLEDYFMISSKSFLDRNKYPPVQIARKKFVEVKTDINNFRINDSYEKNEEKHDKEVNPDNKFFFFRLSGLNLYYANTKSDYNILGAIAVTSLERIQEPSMDATGEYITTCFNIHDAERNTYKMCAMKKDTARHWYCQILSFLGQSNFDMCMKLGDGDTKVITKTVEITQPVVIVPTPSPHCNERWNYNKFGEDWECECKEGKEQSPIDLPVKEQAINTDVAPLFRYKRVKAGDVDATVDGKKT